MYKIEKVSDKINSKPFDLYTYTCYAGKQTVEVPLGDSAWIVEQSGSQVVRGGTSVSFNGMCVIIRGYQCESKSSGYESITNLPYVNGCSSNQIFPPVRLGDPTLQLLYLPPNTHEQMHHVHSTVRCVYVLRGKGKSIQGMDGEIEMELNVGDVIVLDKMTPHHFKTEEEELVVIPLHVYSSIPQMELNHPMMNGTHKV